MTLLLCSLFLIGLLQESGCECGMVTIMMMMVITGIIMMMKINILSGTIVIKNERLRKQRLRKNSCLLLSIHQDIGIGVCQKMKKKEQKNYGYKRRPFCV